MKERIIISETTGQRFKAVPNVLQILENKNSCLGCSFNPTNGRIAPECTSLMRKHKFEQQGQNTGCHDRYAIPELQIIWVEMTDD